MRSEDFYLIAHRVNNKSKIRKSFRQGVNGIECDLWCDDNKKWWVSHNGWWKTDLRKWLNYIGKAEQKYKRKLALILFDIKSEEPITRLREMINTHLPPDLPHIYSVSNLNKACILRDIVPHLSAYEAVSIDEEDDPKQVADFFRKIGVKQCWYGNGITFIPLDGQYHDSMQEAASIRDKTGAFSRIYTWSIHHKKQMLKYILHDHVDGMIVGLNGILTRPVSKALKIIKANGIRLANRQSSIC